MVIDDVGWGDGAVDDIVGMDELYALGDWYKRIEDLFLWEVVDGIGSLPVVYLYF